MTDSCSTETILCGIETEYGMAIDGRTPREQVEDAAELVRTCPVPHWVGWDYRYESPRADLRGFTLASLAVDPLDAAFDAGARTGFGREERADRILTNGARFYNDHGHPEYATPECRSARELALADKAGERVVRASALRCAETTGRAVRIYKNNTDHHGASYGTHESYQVPRELGFEKLYAATLPMLVARIPLCGAGKVGAETGPSATFQLSQRADFFVEAYNAETLYRRPVFNTRDEPHADPDQWIRLHVICGDANLLSSATARKVELVRIALALAKLGEAPVWRLADPVRAFQSVSRDESYEFRIELEGGGWTNAREVVESFFGAAERFLELSEETRQVIAECRSLFDWLRSDFDRFAFSVDWGAKLAMFRQFMESEGCDWRDPALAAYDLEFHNLDPEEGLCRALQGMGVAEPDPPETDLLDRIEACAEPTRALVRGVAASRFASNLVTASWRSLVFDTARGQREVFLDPSRVYAMNELDFHDVESFIEALEP